MAKVANTLMLFVLIFLFMVAATPSESGFSHSRQDIPVRIRSFEVPARLNAGDSAVLRCFYELHENETLYAVKWYKNMGEFFRYVPKSEPQYKALYQPGIDVDMVKSNQQVVYLRNLGLDSLGNYTCQVSTDGPYYRCVQTTKYLDVVVPPSNGPVLLMEPEKSDFQLGDNISILCNSGRSKPAPELTWYINGREAQFDPNDREVIAYPEGLESSSLVLKFHLKPEVFKEGKVVLKCVATLHQVEAAAVREILANSQPSDNHGPTAWVTGTSVLMLLAASQMARI